MYFSYINRTSEEGLQHLLMWLWAVDVRDNEFMRFISQKLVEYRHDYCDLILEL